MSDQESPRDEGADEAGRPVPNPVYDDTKQRQPLSRFHLYRIMGPKLDDVLAYRTDRAPVAYDDVEAEIEEILREIHAKRLDPVGRGLDRIDWYRRNYFVVSFEIPNDSMLPGNAVTFERPDDKSNNTFHDGKDIPVRGELRRFFCINHMKKKDGADMPDGYSEKIEVTVHHHHEPHRDHNATGTNTGPP